MEIQYREPLERSWKRAQGLLLRPFRLELWFIVGFTAWLARLWDGSIWGGDGGLRWDLGDDDQRFGGLLGSGVERIVDALGHPLEFFVAMMLLLLFLAVGAALAWVGSRGTMMFFDNVAWKHGRVSDPWQRLGRLGDSLFLWRVATQLLAGFLALALILPMVIMIVPALGAGGVFAGLGIAGSLLTFIAGFALALAVAFVGFCTDQFVVPLMHRYNEGVLAAWERFLPLLRRHTLSFILMALVYLLVWLVMSVVIFAAGAMTCCALFLVLSIPFVGTVVLLPLHVTLRGFGPEFLAQYGEEYDCWPHDEAADPIEIGPFDDVQADDETSAPDDEPDADEPTDADEDEPQGP